MKNIGTIWYSDWRESTNNAGSGAFVTKEGGVYPLKITGGMPVDRDIKEFMADGPYKDGVFYASSGKTFRVVTPEEFDKKLKCAARAWSDFLSWNSFLDK